MDFWLIWISLPLLNGIGLPNNLVVATENEFENGKCGFLMETHLKDGQRLPWVATLNTRREDAPDTTNPAILISPSLVLMNANLFLEKGLIRVLKFFNLTSYSVSANLSHFGTTNEDDSDIQTVHVKQIRIHPGFKGHNWSLYENDIALIHLDPPFKFDSMVHDICIPTEEIADQITTTSIMESPDNHTNSSVLLFGWKRNQPANIFLRLKVNYQPTCEKFWLNEDETKYSNYGNRFCANVSTDNSHKDCIHRDNGMVGKFDDKYYFLGLVNNFYSDNRICNSNTRIFVLKSTEKSALKFINDNLRCGPDKFSCTNGDCISLENWCNGKDDCGDNSDETDARCKAIVHPFHCVGGEDHCGEKGKCIRVDQFCDGVKDCDNGEDETEARCPSTKFKNNLIDCSSEAGTPNDAFIQSPAINGKEFLMPTGVRKGHWLANFGLCRKHCAEMVTLQSSEENDAFINWFLHFIPSGGNRPIWLGGRFPNIISSYTDNNWYWFSGAPINNSFHPNLSSGEPDERGNNNCLNALYYTDSNNLKKWQSYPCDFDNVYFACQRNISDGNGY